MGTARYAEYTRQLHLLVQDASADRWSRIGEDVTHALNGQAAAELRQLVPLQVRREAGSFFTTGPVRHTFESLLGSQPSPVRSPLLWDPACGAGDLLLAAAQSLPLAATAAETITMWGRRLRGEDLHAPFVEAARLRLTLLVLQQHREAGSPSSIDTRQARRAFPRVREGDGLDALQATAGSRRTTAQLLLNPPYSSFVAPGNCSWAQGKTSMAAQFMAVATEALAPGGRITAVLPDVLRSGSRYRQWRDHVTGVVAVEDVRSHGIFDQHTDVDVFLLSALRRKGGHAGRVAWWPEALDESTSTVGDLFDVAVGTVVDSRDPHEGPSVPYLTARQLPPSGIVDAPERKRNFRGRLFAPPFVVVRRTSRPGQGVDGMGRGAGVLVAADEQIAVDNHLIVLSPKPGGRTECPELLSRLAEPRTEKWLDERIRCRHLTVSAMRALPWS